MAERSATVVVVVVVGVMLVLLLLVVVGAGSEVGRGRYMPTSPRGPSLLVLELRECHVNGVLVKPHPSTKHSFPLDPSPSFPFSASAGKSRRDGVLEVEGVMRMMSVARLALQHLQKLGLAALEAVMAVDPDVAFLGDFLREGGGRGGGREGGNEKEKQADVLGNGKTYLVLRFLFERFVCFEARDNENSGRTIYHQSLPPSLPPLFRTLKL